VTTERGLEVRLKRRWQVAIAIGVPLFALLLVAGSAAFLSGPSPGLVGVLGVVFIVATLGGLVVVPGVLLLRRYARGIPDLRLDDRRILASMNRLRYGTTFAISTAGADRSWEDIRAALGARLPAVPFDEA
jgi:hypothetical protein